MEKDKKEILKKKRVYEITENSPCIYNKANNIRFMELE